MRHCRSHARDGTQCSQALPSAPQPVLLPIKPHPQTVRNGMSMSAQVDEVAAFVANNARRVLGVDAAQVLPVSARAALDAKLASTKDKRGFFGEQLHELLDSMKDCMLRFACRWQAFSP